MKIIESAKAINAAISRYPNTRATIEASKKILERGAGYGDFQIGDIFTLEDSQYTLLRKQINSYIKIEGQLCKAYSKDTHFRRYVKALVLQFENSEIESLVKDYPIATLAGARFATDTMVTEDRGFKTAEVNIGPVGGPAENIAAQKLLKNIEFPISGDIYLDHFIWSTNSYYLKACKAMGITPKPFGQRHVVYIENDGWFSGSFDFVSRLQAAGMNIDIVPRESLQYDEANNTLNFVENGSNNPVDQAILYFHLQEDLPQGDNEYPYGHILKALQNHAVITETSPFSLIVLASKSISGLIYQMANNPEGFLAQRLDIDLQDLAQVKDMFPATYHWRSKFFKRQAILNKFSIPGFFSANGYIVKSTRTDMYGGRGVFGSRNRDGKDYLALYANLREEIGKVLSLKPRDNILRKISDNTFFIEFQKHVANEERLTKKSHDKVSRINLDLLFEMLNNGIDNTVSQKMGLTEDDLLRLRNVFQKTQSGIFKDSKDFDKFLEDYVYLLALGSQLNITSANIEILINGIISYLSTEMVLPFVIQEKILTTSSDEIRISGFIGDQPLNHVDLFSTIKQSFQESPSTILNLFKPELMPAKYNNRTEVAESKILEVEATAPLESTALELSPLSSGKEYDCALILMCGAGRHARYLASRTKEIIGVDISPKFVEEAVSLNGDLTNIYYAVADARDYLKHADMQNKFDLEVLLGLGLSYLVPSEQLDLLKDVYSSLSEGSTLVFDFVDLCKFGKLLNIQGPVGSRFIDHNGRALERLTRREIKKVDSRKDFYFIEDTTAYVTDNAYEIMNEKSRYYVPVPDGVYEAMHKMGYKNLTLQSLFDDRYVGMLRYRWIVTADK